MDVVIKKIVIPVDFSAASERAARYGCSLARTLGARVYLIHVVEPSMKDSMDVRQRALVTARAELAAFARKVGAASPITTEVRTGRVAESVTTAVTAYGGDLVVMSTHGRTGLSHLMYGSVAEEVIRTIECPVLVLRESGSVRMHHAAA